MLLHLTVFFSSAAAAPAVQPECALKAERSLLSQPALWEGSAWKISARDHTLVQTKHFVLSHLPKAPAISVDFGRKRHDLEVLANSSRTGSQAISATEVGNNASAGWHFKLRIGDVSAGDSQSNHQHDANTSADISICEKDVFARQELCPEQCPFAAELEEKSCHFRCVTKDECGYMGTVPNAIIPDEHLHACRPCKMPGCKTCVSRTPGMRSEDLDGCDVCMLGYYITDSGACQLRSLWIFVLITTVGCVVGGLTAVWYAILRMRPVVNQDCLDFAFECRERSALKQPGRESSYPIFTNLLRTNVAGVGTMCLFRFQFALIVWAVLLLTLWLFLAFFVSPDLLRLGNRDARSPQMLCALVTWGRRRQIELLWTKVLWLASAYMFSFLGALAYAVQQAKLFIRADLKQISPCDFAAVLEGLPELDGSVNTETTIKGSVELASGERVAGISIAWNYSQQKSEIEAFAEMDLFDENESESESRSESNNGNEVESSSGILNVYEHVAQTTSSLIFNMWQIDPENRQCTHDEISVLRNLLLGLRSTDTAFVIFLTLEARNSALKRMKQTGIKINGKMCTLKECPHAPREIQWENFHVNKGERQAMFLNGVLMVIGACVCWTAVLYMPYAYYMASFSYAHGDEPGSYSIGVFIGLVVGSQFGLFVCSSRAAHRSQFRYKIETHRTYTWLYNAALILNLVMDIILQAYLSYLHMVGAGAVTANGQLLGNLTSFQEIFESYPMQKSFGNLLLLYCWPCTFLIPFILEPIIVQWLPQHIGTLLVRADTRIKGPLATKTLALGQMEQGRYADVIFNAILLMCIPLVAPAYMHLTFLALIASHVYLYCYDQVKVLRYVVSFSCCTGGVHSLGQQLFVIPVSLLAGALVFKGNQMLGGKELGSGCLQGPMLLFAVVLAMLSHAALHLAALHWIAVTYEDRSRVRGAMEESEDEDSDSACEVDASNTMTSRDMQRLDGATYFSVNPVHCLRSRCGLLGRGNAVSYFSSLGSACDGKIAVGSTPTYRPLPMEVAPRKSRRRGAVTSEEVCDRLSSVDSVKS